MKMEQLMSCASTAAGRIHSIETFGSVDGPGIRFVIFLQGCRLRCRYCHNVDTWDDHGGWEQPVKAADLLKKALRYRSYWGPDGGITVSGGEPLLQMEFLQDLFEQAKALGIHTCIDTAGEPFRTGVKTLMTNRSKAGDAQWFESFRKLMKVTDLLLVDIKHIDPEKNQWLTGASNKSVLSMLRYLDSIAKPVWIRHVLVPGITDHKKDLQKLREFLDTLTNVERVEILPYHTMAIPKWDELGIPYTLRGVEPPTKECIDEARQILQAI